MAENNVTALPTAAADPLPKRRWHGCYPKGVVPISRQRYKRASEDAAARREHVDEYQRELTKIREDQAARGCLPNGYWPWPGIDIGRFERLPEALRDALGFVFLDALCRMERRADERTD